VSDFIDSNVLVYCLVRQDPRFERARAILDRGPITSVQALNEMVSVARAKYHVDWPELNAFTEAAVELLAEILPLLPEDNRRARRLAERYKLQWWDALIVATALRTGADRLITEDLQHGQVIEERLAVVNPFRDGSVAR
jgi:predicted nucleic acid-binding protein